VSLVRNSLFPYLLASTVFHLVLAFTWGNRPVRPAPMEEILVKLLPPPAAQEKPAPRAAAPAPPPQPAKQVARETPREKPTRAELPLGQHAKIDRPGAEIPPKKEKKVTPEKPVENIPEEPEFATADDGQAIASRSLPTLKELLPPIYRAYPNSRNDDSTPVRLDSRDPLQKRYLDRVKQALNIAWDDPRVAPSVRQPYGVEGRAVVEFVIRETGQIDNLRIIKSSGYAPIDQEVVRVVIAAAPHFGPIPRDVGAKSLLITLGVTFENSGWSYSLSPTR